MTKRHKTNRDQITAEWNRVARRRLRNRRIVDVRYLSTDECRQLMCGFASIVLVLDDGTTVYAARDAEGNDAGAFHGVSPSGEKFVLPGISVG
jgi:hypothetical protein